jgi:UDP-N-acetylmuramate dehydrogenase
MSPARSAEGGPNEYAAFCQTAERLGLVVVPDEPLARHCTFRIGGPADLFAAAEDICTLERLADLAAKHGIPVTVLGGGSNVLISDRGVRGLVVANRTREFGIGMPDLAPSGAPKQGEDVGEGQADEGSHLVTDSGVALAGLARWAIRSGWSGLEWAVSIPGTVGGAVIGNAGAHGGQIADNLDWVLLAAPQSGHKVLAAHQLGFSYRECILKQELASAGVPSVVLRASFSVAPGDTAHMTARAESFLAKRRASQPVEPSAGSVFRNPPGDHAGRLIEAVGLKGHRIGNVQVSPRHANFIINTGEGRAVEVAELIRLVQQKVREAAGVKLIPEILYLGDWTGIE